jgi:hypothetical protein
VTAAGPIDVATLTIRWASTVGDVALHTVTVPVRVTAGSGPDTGADNTVTEEVVRLEVARKRREAREAAERGDYGTASTLLSSGADAMMLLPDGLSVARELRRDADALQAGMWSADDAKRNFSRSRSAQKGRRTDYTAADPEEPQA